MRKRFRVARLGGGVQRDGTAVGARAAARQGNDPRPRAGAGHIEEVSARADIFGATITGADGADYVVEPRAAATSLRKARSITR